MVQAAKPEIVLPERPLFDQARLAVAGFLARYSDSTAERSRRNRRVRRRPRGRGFQDAGEV